MNGKRVSESLAEQVHVLTMETLNGNDRLSGFQLMKWIDEVATVAARRHAESDVTTARVDNLQFLRPAINKDTVVVQAHLTHTGTSSMDVRVDAFAQRFSGPMVRIAVADVLMVSLDEQENKHAVPPLCPETEEEKRDWLEAEERSRCRKKAE